MAHADAENNSSSLFIDTNLDTHFVSIVSYSDTISDLKRKIMLEHQECFPAIGDIKIDSLKVKRRGHFYHLSDSMLVKSVFATAKDDWFLSVDASRLAQAVGIQKVDNCKVRDQLALPRATDNRSVDEGSPSTHVTIVPVVNHVVSSVNQFRTGNSDKDYLKNTGEDRSFDHGIISKKRTLVQTESLLEDASGVEKKRKTEEKEANVKASEDLGDENIRTNNENSIENNIQDLKDDSTGLNKGEKCSGLDQEATVVSSSIENIGAETHVQKNTETSEIILPDVLMNLEKNIELEIPSEISQKEKGESPFVQNNSEASETVPAVLTGVQGNIQQEISQKEKDNELVGETVMGNEIPSSLLRTSDCELDDSEKDKTAEKEVLSTSLIKTLHTLLKDAADMSEKDLGSTVQESAGDETHNHKEDKESSRKQESEVKLPRSKKKAKKSAARNNDESAKNKDELGKRKDDSSKNNDGVKVPRTEKNVNQGNDEGIDTTPENQNEKIDGEKRKKRKKKTKKSAKNGEGGVSTEVSHLNENAKEHETARKNGDEVKGRDAQVLDVGLVTKAKKNRKSSVTGPEDMPGKCQSTELVELEPEKGQSTDHQTSKNMTVSDEGNVLKEGSRDIDFLDYFTPGKDTTTSVKVKKPKKKTKQQFFVDFRNDSAIQPQNENVPTNVVNDPHISNTDQCKTPKKKSKIDAPRISKSAHANKAHGEPSAEVFLNQKSDRPRVILGLARVKTVQKNAPEVNVSEHVKTSLSLSGTIFGDDNEEGSADDNASPRKSSSSRDTAPSIDSGRCSVIEPRNKKIPTNVVNDPHIPNTDQFKTPKKKSKIDAPRISKSAHANKAHGEPSAEVFLNQKSDRPPVTLGLASVKSMQKNAPEVNISEHVKFGGDNEEGSADENASPRKSSSSGDTAPSIDSGSCAVKRKGSGENSQSKSKNLSMTDHVRSSPRLKRTKVTTSQQLGDTERERMEFVPESPPTAVAK